LPPVSTSLAANYPLVSTVANYGNNISLLRPSSELEGNILSLYLLYYPKMSKQKIKIFLIDEYFHLPPVLMTSTVHLSCEYLHELLKKFEMALMYTRGIGGNRFMKKPKVENLMALSL
jgi:hypothetical protein